MDSTNKKGQIDLSSPFKGTGGGSLGLRVEHRFVLRDGFTPSGATALLLGTFPSVLVREAFGRVRPTDVDFFYGSADNNFWKDLSIIYNRPLSFTRTDAAIEERKQLLTNLQLAISDAIIACTTSGSAMDTALHNIELNKYIISVLDQHPTITRLYFTSSSGKVNAETLTLRLLKEQGRSSGMRILQQSSPRRRTFQYRDAQNNFRLFDTVTLISPSPLAEQMAGIHPEQRRALYRQWLPKL